MALASSKQLKYINSMRQIFSDYNVLIEDKYQIPTAEEVYDFTVKQASEYIGKNKLDFQECLEVIFNSREE